MTESREYQEFTILEPLPEKRPPLRCVLFDFDGTISTLRQGWEGVMAPLMLEMIAGPTTPTDELRREVEEYIDFSTGIQTIHQMKWLSEAVERYGLNPQVNNEWEYKEEYNRRLMQPVSARARKIAVGDAKPDDFMMAGAREFVETLKEKGLAIYVASGTDHPDVMREVGILGLTEYFEEIAGAPIGKVDCSKEAVLRRLIEEKNLSGLEVVVIGDGRVEIGLAREMSAIALGVATDEVERKGVNPAKYKRLQKAGAHAIVGDFRPKDAICEWLAV